MKKSILIISMFIGYSFASAQTTSNISPNGIPEGIQQTTSPGIENTTPNFQTTPYTQPAPIPTPVAPNIQTTTPGMETQPSNNTQYPSGDNNSSNANTNGTINTGIISPPRK